MQEKKDVECTRTINQSLLWPWSISDFSTKMKDSAGLVWSLSLNQNEWISLYALKDVWSGGHYGSAVTVITRTCTFIQLLHHLLFNIHSLLFKWILSCFSLHIICILLQLWMLSTCHNYANNA